MDNHSIFLGVSTITSTALTITSSTSSIPLQLQQQQQQLPSSGLPLGEDGMSGSASDLGMLASAPLSSSPAGDTESVLVSLTHTLGLVLALMGNFSVIVIIARTQKLHTPSSILVLMLACSDLILSWVWNLVPMVTTLDTRVRGMLHAGVASCNVIGFSWQTLLTISTMFHSVVALDRYLFIVHPMKYQVYVTAKAITILTSCILVLAFASSGRLLVFGSGFRYLHVTGICVGSPLWAVLYLVVIFIPSLAVALFAYQRIWKLCISVFERDDIDASHGHTPRVSFSSQIPPLSFSTNSHSKSDLGASSDVEGGGHLGENIDDKSLRTHRKQQQQQQHQYGTKQHPDQNILTLATSEYIREKPWKNTVTTSIRHQLSPDPTVPVENPAPILLTSSPIQHGKAIKKGVVDTKTYREESIKSPAESRIISSNLLKSRNSIPKDFEINVKQKLDTQYSVESANTQPHKLAGNTPAWTKPKKQRRFSIDSFLSFPKIMQNTPKEPLATVVIHTPVITEEDNQPVSSLGAADSSFHRGSSLTISSQNIFSKRASTQDYETITKKLFGSESLLPSLLYVGILMPLSHQPVSASTRHRRLRACLLVGLPIFMLIVSFIPFPVSLIYLGYSEYQDHDEGKFDDIRSPLIKVICHLCYALVPSLTSLLLCLNNKPYRRALSQALGCGRCLCYDARR